MPHHVRPLLFQLSLLWLCQYLLHISLSPRKAKRKVVLSAPQGFPPGLAWMTTSQKATSDETT